MSKQLYYRMSKIKNRPPLSPRNVTAEVSGSDIVVGCDAVPTADSYNFYTSIDGGTWTLLGNEATTSYTFTPTEPGEYNFYVTSVRGSAESVPSAETLTTETMMETVYSDTITGLRISAVDGTAFVDEAAAITAYADGNHLLEIEDSLGNVASGVLSAQGSGEVLGTEQVSTWTNFMSSYETFSSSGQNIASAINTDSSGVAYAAVSVSTGELVKYIGDITINSGYFSNGLLLRLQRGAGTSALFTRAAGSHSLYLTSVVDATSLEFTTTTGVDFSASNNSLKQVTAPSTSGAFIVSEIDGATQNFVSIPAGFTYNESSYICRVKKILPTA